MKKEKQNYSLIVPTIHNKDKVVDLILSKETDQEQALSIWNGVSNELQNEMLSPEGHGMDTSLIVKLDLDASRVNAVMQYHDDSLMTDEDATLLFGIITPDDVDPEKIAGWLSQLQMIEMKIGVTFAAQTAEAFSPKTIFAIMQAEADSNGANIQDETADDDSPEHLAEYLSGLMSRSGSPGQDMPFTYWIFQNCPKLYARVLEEYLEGRHSDLNADHQVSEKETKNFILANQHKEGAAGNVDESQEVKEDLGDEGEDF